MYSFPVHLLQRLIWYLSWRTVSSLFSGYKYNNICGLKLAQPLKYRYKKRLHVFIDLFLFIWPNSFAKVTSNSISCKNIRKKYKYFFISFGRLLFSLESISFRDRLGGVMVHVVSVLASSAEGRGFDPRSGQTKDIKIGICFFSAKHAPLRRKRKDWSALNQKNVSG